MTIQQRLKAPTPTFFRKIKKVSLAVASIGAVLLAAPVGLPAVVIKAAGYMIVAGSVASTVSQLTTDSKKIKTQADG